MAVGAANFYGQASGKTAFVNLHVAPGLGNGMGNLYTASVAGTPLLVLVGAQGAKKSTSLETLVGEQWFGSTKLDLANKDSFLQLRGKWLYEIGEMEGIKRADANVSKQWLSNRVDTYRAPYARRAEDHPRQTVMAFSSSFLPCHAGFTGSRPANFGGISIIALLISTATGLRSEA